MATTALEVFNIMLAMADQLDESTGLANPTDTDGYKYRVPGILTSLQSELIKSGDLFSTFEIACKPATNILGAMSGFDYIEYIGTEITKEGNGSTKAYYFEVSDNATVYIEDYNGGSWNTLATVTATPTVGGYTAYKGIVTPTVGATKSRIRFAGSYRYIFTNYALFSAPFSSADDVPMYRPWYKVTMPADFKSVEQIINEYPQRQYVKDSAYKWEGKGDLYINYAYEGNIRISYRPIPLSVTSISDNLQLDDVTCRTLLVYGLGMELFKEESDVVYKHFLNRYRELKALSMIKQPATEQLITNMYGPI
jgi:hypothetical protein